MHFREAQTPAKYGDAGAAALAEIYHSYERFFVSVATGVLHDAGEARECVHEVLVRLLRDPQKFDARRGTLKSFLTVAVRNEALSRIRRKVRESSHVQMFAGDAIREDDTAALAQRSDVDTALRVLTPDQRTVVLLAYYGQYTHQEIASRLKQPVGTVKSRLSGALRRLRTVLVHDDE